MGNFNSNKELNSLNIKKENNHINYKLDWFTLNVFERLDLLIEKYDAFENNKKDRLNQNFRVRNILNSFYSIENQKEHLVIENTILGNDKKVIDLIEHGQDVNEKFKYFYNSTPIQWACCINNLKMFLTLLKLGADPSQRNGALNDSLMDAQREKSQKIIEFLLEQDCLDYCKFYYYDLQQKQKIKQTDNEFKQKLDRIKNYYNYIVHEFKFQRQDLNKNQQHGILYNIGTRQGTAKYLNPLTILTENLEIVQSKLSKSITNSTPTGSVNHTKNTSSITNSMQYSSQNDTITLKENQISSHSDSKLISFGSSDQDMIKLDAEKDQCTWFIINLKDKYLKLTKIVYLHESNGGVSQKLNFEVQGGHDGINWRLITQINTNKKINRNYLWSIACHNQYKYFRIQNKHQDSSLYSTGLEIQGYLSNRYKITNHKNLNLNDEFPIDLKNTKNLLSDNYVNIIKLKQFIWLLAPEDRNIMLSDLKSLNFHDKKRREELEMVFKNSIMTDIECKILNLGINSMSDFKSLKDNIIAMSTDDGEQNDKLDSSNPYQHYQQQKTNEDLIKIDTQTSAFGGELGELIKNSYKHKIVFLTFFNNQEEIEKFKNLTQTEKIGEGGEGSVQKSNPIDGVTQAVKVFKLDTSDEESLKKRINDLMKEFFTFKHINHQYLVNYYYLDVPEQVSDIYMYVKLVMKYIKGMPLSHLLRQLQLTNSTLEESKVLQICRCVLLALRQLHKHDIVHRDLKPSNVMIDEQCVGQLTDQGISKHLDKNQGGSGQHTNVGTPLQISPDVIRNTCYKKTDVQSFGVMLLELQTGKRPFYGIPESERINNLIQNGVTQWKQFQMHQHSEFNQQAQDICEMCMNIDVEMRPSVDDLLNMDLFRESAD